MTDTTTLTNPHQPQTDRFEAAISTVKAAPRSNLIAMTPEVRAVAHAKRLALVAEWGKLGLRQDFADEAPMRSYLRAAGVRIGSDLEPATPRRVALVLSRVGVTAPMIRQAVGAGITGYLEKNPRLPLWAAVALILEACA
jgi:hypothetical protein